MSDAHIGVTQTKNDRPKGGHFRLGNRFVFNGRSPILWQQAGSRSEKLPL